jgi:hypothetical protein
VSVALDHLVVVAATLDQGVHWCEETLGVTPVAGGRHALMGTHNRLLAMGGTRFPGSYLEIIAIDREAPEPPHARWFGMDDPALQAQVALEPQLVHWVARCQRIDAPRDALLSLGLDPGPARAAERQTAAGLLRWRITVRADGKPLYDGALPTLIEWRSAQHPADTLPACGIQLHGLTLRRLPEPAAETLGLAAAGIRCESSPGPAIEARLSTPRGPLRLASDPATPH